MHDKDAAIPKILDGLREGLPEYQACQNAGVGFNTFFTWKREVPGLAQQVDAAKASRITLYEDALHKAALKGNITAIMLSMRKYSKEWRELIDGNFEANPPQGNPAQNNAIAAGIAGATAVIALMKPEVKERLRIAMKNSGMLIQLPKNGNGTNGNGSGAH